MHNCCDSIRKVGADVWVGSTRGLCGFLGGEGGGISSVCYLAQLLALPTVKILSFFVLAQTVISFARTRGWSIQPDQDQGTTKYLRMSQVVHLNGGKNTPNRHWDQHWSAFRGRQRSLPRQTHLQFYATYAT